MTVTSTVLIPSKTAEVVDTTQYTSANLTTIIDKFTAVNTSTTAAATISVNLVTSGESVSDSNIMVKTKNLQPLETYTFPEVVGHVLLSGGFISTATSAATITIRASGRTVT
jgi:hypothetical protein